MWRSFSFFLERNHFPSSVRENDQENLRRIMGEDRPNSSSFCRWGLAKTMFEDVVDGGGLCCGYNSFRRGRGPTILDDVSLVFSSVHPPPQQFHVHLSIPKMEPTVGCVYVM